MRRRTIGLITLGVVLTALGVGLLMDRNFGYNILPTIVKFWPLALILLGLEYVVSSRNLEFPSSVNILALLVLVIVLGASWVYVEAPRSFVDIGRFSGYVRFGNHGNFGTRERFEIELEFDQVAWDGLKTISVQAIDDVTIVGSDSDTIFGTARVTVSARTLEEAKLIAGQLEVESRNRGSILALGIALPDQMPYDAGIQESFSLTVPSGVGLDISTVSGEIIVEDVSGAATLNSVSGDIEVDDRASSVSLNNISGRASLVLTKDTESIKCNTVSGDVDITVIDGAGGKLNYSSVSGDLIPSISGIKVTEGPGSYKATGQFGTGNTRIEVETVSGNLSLNRSRTD